MVLGVFINRFHFKLDSPKLINNANLKLVAFKKLTVCFVSSSIIALTDFT